MSRIGRAPIAIPSGVDVRVADGSEVTVTGPRGSLTRRVHPEMRVVVEEGSVRIERPSDAATHRSLHGLTRTLIANMVDGVTKGFERRLTIIGVGYRAALKGKDLEMALGFSHPVTVPAPAGIEFEVPAATSVIIRGNDKEAVGQIAANIRKLREPEPYKGKGIRYEDEIVRKKAGKAAKGSA